MALVVSQLGGSSNAIAEELLRIGACASTTQQVYIPAGTFWMGSSRDEREYAYRLDRGITRNYGWYEKEQRKLITTADFCIDRFPTTNAQYRTFIERTRRPAPFISESAYRAQGFLVHPYDKVKAFIWLDGSFPQGKGDHPVVLVSHRDAEEYCAWIGPIAKRNSRLPTESEWEKAARGTSGRYFPWGNEWKPKNLNSGERYKTTTSVGLFPDGQSPYGVYDMVGNVFEWTGSQWDKNFVVKGCSWDDLPGTCRAAMRHGRPPQSKHILIGFRCASDMEYRHKASQ